MAPQPRHVDGCAGAAVGVRRGAVQGGDVVTRVNHQEIVGADAAENDEEEHHDRRKQDGGGGGTSGERERDVCFVLDRVT